MAGERYVFLSAPILAQALGQQGLVTYKAVPRRLRPSGWNEWLLVE
jgi:hypothetical protein